MSDPHPFPRIPALAAEAVALIVAASLAAMAGRRRKARARLGDVRRHLDAMEEALWPKAGDAAPRPAFKPRKD
jgi:hypothetical protein